jgi:hypothetical protein
MKVTVTGPNFDLVKQLAVRIASEVCGDTFVSISSRKLENGDREVTLTVEVDE